MAPAHAQSRQGAGRWNPEVLLGAGREPPAHVGAREVGMGSSVAGEEGRQDLAKEQGEVWLFFLLGFVFAFTLILFILHSPKTELND
jgi:hypothetical protein